MNITYMHAIISIAFYLILLDVSPGMDGHLHDIVGW